MNYCPWLVSLQPGNPKETSYDTHHLSLRRAIINTWHRCEKEGRLAILNVRLSLLNWASLLSHCACCVLKTLISKPGDVSGFHGFPLHQQCKCIPFVRTRFWEPISWYQWEYPANSCLLFLFFLSKNLSAWVPLLPTLIQWIASITEPGFRGQITWVQIQTLFITYL